MIAKTLNKNILRLRPSKKTLNKTLCLVQITRIGDLIQTIQVAKNCKKEHPHLRLMLIARRKFAKELLFLIKKTFDDYFLFDLKDDFIKEKNASLETSLKNLSQYIEKINSCKIDVLINLSFSKSSSYLCSMIKAVHKLGPYYDHQNRINIKDTWSQLVYSNVMKGPLNPFSLIDIYRSIVGIKKPLPVPTRDGKNLNEAKKRIVVHPFSSHSKKMWKQNKWVEVIYKLLKKNSDLTISLVGSKEELEQSKNIVDSPLLNDFKNQITNHVGNFSIEQLTDHIKGCTLFVGHDSMIGHLSSFTGTPAITISIGSVRPVETTPYRENNFNLVPKTKCFPCFPDEKCDHWQCHVDIPYQVVFATIQLFIDNKEINQKHLKDYCSAFHLNSTYIYKTSINQSSHFLQIDDVLDSEQSLKDVFRQYYRIAWQFTLRNCEEASSFPNITYKTHKELINYLEGLQYLYELCEFGKKYSNDILQEVSSKLPQLPRIKERSKKIDEIDELQNLIKQSYKHLSAIIDHFAIVKGNLKGQNIVELSESSYLAFQDCANMAGLIYELIEKTIMEYKANSRKTIQSTEHGESTKGF